MGEPFVLDEPTTADLAGKVTEAWRDFARALADALGQLEPGVQLDLTLDPTASGTGDAVYGVNVHVLAEGAVRVYAVGNGSLPEGYRLGRSAIAELVALGWSPPGVVEGSGDQFGLAAPSADAGRIAVIVVRTLRDVYGAPHPAFLTYVAIAEDGKAVTPPPPLGSARPLLDRAEAAQPTLVGNAIAVRELDDPHAPLDERVSAVVASLLKTTPEALQVDSDGDISIRSGSAMVFVRVRDNPPLVDVFSPVLTEVRPTEELYTRLSELTNRMPIGRLYCTNDTVWASVPVFGRDFQPTHLMLAVQVMTGLADELDDRLHGEFGGKRFFSEGDKPLPAEPDAGTGMYL